MDIKYKIMDLHQQREQTLDGNLLAFLHARSQHEHVHVLDQSDYSSPSSSVSSVSSKLLAVDIQQALNHVMTKVQETNDMKELTSYLKIYQIGMASLEKEVLALKEVICVLVILTCCVTNMFCGFFLYLHLGSGRIKRRNQTNPR